MQLWSDQYLSAFMVFRMNKLNAWQELWPLPEFRSCSDNMEESIIGFGCLAVELREAPDFQMLSPTIWSAVAVEGKIFSFGSFFIHWPPAAAPPPQAWSTFTGSNRAVRRADSVALQHTNARTRTHTASYHCSINSSESITGPAGVSSSAKESNGHSSFICLRVRWCPIIKVLVSAPHTRRPQWEESRRSCFNLLLPDRKSSYKFKKNATNLDLISAGILFYEMKQETETDGNNNGNNPATPWATSCTLQEAFVALLFIHIWTRPLEFGQRRCGSL